jgi:hypothetical protein
MKAWLINPFDRTITEVEHNGDYRHIYTLIDCDTFDCVRFSDNGDAIYVDDEGLLKDLSKQQFFALPSIFPESAYAGKGLVLGVDGAGDTVAPDTSLDEMKKLVVFMTSLEVYVKFAG